MKSKDSLQGNKKKIKLNPFCIELYNYYYADYLQSFQKEALTSPLIKCRVDSSLIKISTNLDIKNVIFSIMHIFYLYINRYLVEKNKIVINEDLQVFLKTDHWKFALELFSHFKIKVSNYLNENSKKAILDKYIYINRNIANENVKTENNVCVCIVTVDNQKKVIAVIYLHKKIFFTHQTVFIIILII